MQKMKTVGQLIEELKAFPDEMLVQICDLDKVEAAGEATREGIYDFEVEEVTEDFIPDGTKPWLALHFTPEQD